MTKPADQLVYPNKSHPGAASGGWIDGRTAHPLYARWYMMIQRCTNPKAPAWKFYGARGTQVCERWTDNFWAYVEDMYPTFEPGLEMDRIDTLGNYEPGNVRWVTHAENLANRRQQEQCINGHDFTTHGFRNSEGSLACRTCKRAAGAAYMRRRRAAEKAARVSGN